MRITGKTRVTGLFGYPVEHTLSPPMQNAAFEHLGLDFRYLPFLVRPGEIAEAVAAIRTLNLAGVNVTVPHKEAVIPHLDEVSDEAAFIGAVNTIVNDDGKLKGYNTDGRGFMESLAEHGVAADGKRVLVVGAGGASRAVGYYLSEKARELCLYDLDRAKQERLVADLARIRSNVLSVHTLQGCDSFDILVNATPLGLKEHDPLPLPVEKIRPSQTVCDLVYRQTPLLRHAAERGCRILDGLGMLLWQGVLAFELWTKVKPPVQVMRDALLRAFSGAKTGT